MAPIRSAARETCPDADRPVCPQASARVGGMARQPIASAANLRHLAAMKQTVVGASAMARAALAAGLGITLAAAVAPPAPAPPAEESIVVTGTPLTREEIRRRAVEFVRGSGVASGNTPAARWSDPVCPRVLGLTADQAYAVEARIRAIADATGIKAARAPCESNIAISFTPDAAAVVREVERRSPRR